MIEHERLQDAENEGFMDVIKKLDKHTLNMYTAHRAGLEQEN